MLASLRWAEGEREGFTRSFDEALTQAPNSMELRREQLVVLVDAEHYEEALARVEQGGRMFGGANFVRDLQSGDPVGERRRRSGRPIVRAARGFEPRQCRDVARAPFASLWPPRRGQSAIDPWLGTPEQDPLLALCGDGLAADR